MRRATRACIPVATTLNFSPAVSSHNEGDGLVQVTANLSAVTCRDITVYYSTMGTSILGIDFSGLSAGSFTIPKGSSSAQISFSVDQNAVQSIEPILGIYAKGTGSATDNVTFGEEYGSTQAILDDETVGYKSITAIGGSDDTQCAVDSTGLLSCWGSNDYSKVGDGTTVDRAFPVIVENVSFQKVMLGRQHTCALSTTNKIYCWGANQSTFAYALGLGHTNLTYSATIVDPDTDYKDLTVGNYGGCGITTSDDLKCWGTNASGQIGDGTTTTSSTPKFVDAGVKYKKIASGKGGTGSSTCGITSADKLRCWGEGSSGILGLGTTTDFSSPQDVDTSVSYKEIALGANHACAITTANKLRCWGQNTYSKATGNGSVTQQNSPVDVENAVNYVSASAGTQHTCAITDGGVLKCWGLNTGYVLGDGTTTTRTAPVVSDSGTTYLSVDAAEGHTCGITSGQVAKCWGANGQGRLSNGTVSTGSNTPTVVDSGVSYDGIVGSVYHSCGVTSSGKIKCSGYNQYGELGDGSTVQRSSFTELDMGSYGSVSIGRTHSCALTAAGKAKCWGDNTYGQLGLNSVIARTRPEIVVGGYTWSKISAGAYHTCGITTAGALYCWGLNTNAQCTSSGNKLIPFLVTSGTTYTDVATGEAHTCAVTTAGVLKCWGLNDYSQLGDGTVTQRSGATTIDAATTYSKVTAGSAFSCGITTADVLKCWGAADNGRLGNGSFSGTVTTPAVADSGVSYSQVSGVYAHGCGIVKTTGVLKCWGYNNEGMLGDGSKADRSTFTVIDSGVAYSKVSTAKTHTCGVTTGGIMKCWGANWRGQLGDGIGGTVRVAPVLVDRDSASSLAVGGASGCLISSGGQLSCWGYNASGQVGDGTATTRSNPRIVDVGVAYSVVDLGIRHSCAVTTSGVLKCWGRNDVNQLGDGSTTSRSLPVVIDSGVTYSRVSAGGHFSCGVTAAGILKCWGANNVSQLGDNTTTNRATPTVIDSGITYDSVDVNYQTSCGITTTGVLKCWGSNNYGQVGDGSTATRTTPVVVDSGTTYQKVALGDSNTCGITTSGVLKCWGYSGWGELGQGNTTNSNVPLVVDGGVTYSKIAMSRNTVCGITTGNVLKCWGSNEKYQVFSSAVTSVLSPTILNAGVSYSDVAVGGSNSSTIYEPFVCAKRSEGVECWGGNTYSSTAFGPPVLRPKYVPKIRQP